MEGLELLRMISETLPPKYKLTEIYNAKVPIIKFSYDLDGRQIRGDISGSNHLALHNSKLLAVYARFDSRVTILGVLIKQWANVFCINDSYSRTLSSYGKTFFKKFKCNILLF